MAATSKDATIQTLGRLLQIGEDYNGMPTDKLRQEVVEAIGQRDRLRNQTSGTACSRSSTSA